MSGTVGWVRDEEDETPVRAFSGHYVFQISGINLSLSGFPSHDTDEETLVKPS
ncbi:uncharacterized protein ARMOST_20116 [Armillaria ostoyae]|uniref:Uncharacterized protein n=1 Tax=Armillaria ostoyae TaxID=47428 RepID=A0A284S6G0_ARMOS|nr:uncharacterized protein ARMOST_20116 [Armillaria ostoyae]